MPPTPDVLSLFWAPISAVGSLSPQPGDEVVELEGWLLLPAAVEPHAHLDKAFLAERIVNTTGQSGLLGSSHYGDMIDLWQSVGYHPLRFDRAEIERVSEDVLTLQP